MKTQVLFMAFLALFLGLSSCSSGSVQTQATGFAYEVVVVMDSNVWKAEAGEMIKADLAAPVRGLPQAEAAMKITYSEPSVFNGLLEYVRNILIVKIDPAVYTKTSLSYENDRWARNQVVLSLRTPHQDSIVSYLKANPDVLCRFFENVEKRRAVEQLKESYSSLVMEKLKAQFGVELNAPSNFNFYKEAQDFFWSSNNANTGRMDLVVYTFPYQDENTFTPEYLVAKRDSVMKLNMPGSFPGSYMQTEHRAGIDYEAITLNGKYCGAMRGLWRVEGDMMGGPFVSLARLDEQNNRVIVAEGFVYAPETEKRNYIRRIEAALYTLRLPGELESADEEVNGIAEEKSDNN